MEIWKGCKTLFFQILLQTNLSFDNCMVLVDSCAAVKYHINFIMWLCMPVLPMKILIMHLVQNNNKMLYTIHTHGRYLSATLPETQITAAKVLVIHHKSLQWPNHMNDICRHLKAGNMQLTLKFKKKKQNTRLSISINFKCFYLFSKSPAIYKYKTKMHMRYCSI